MAYKINYDCGQAPRTKRNLKPIVAMALIILLIASAVTFKVVGLPWVREVLLPGDPAVTAMALDGLVANIKDGTPLISAIEIFCREIIANAQIH